MAGKFELKKARGGQFLFNLLAGNGRVVLTSELYKSKASALNGIRSVQRNATKDKCYDRNVARSGKPCFTLCATNGEVIGRSQIYASTAGRNNGIRSVMSHAPGASVDDRTA